MGEVPGHEPRLCYVCISLGTIAGSGTAGGHCAGGTVSPTATGIIEGKYPKPTLTTYHEAPLGRGSLHQGGIVGRQYIDRAQQGSILSK